MIGQFLIAMWSVVAVIAGIQLGTMMSSHGQDMESVKLGALAYKAFDPIAVPVIENGEVQGYAIAKFILGTRDSTASALGASLSYAVHDVAIRTLYAREAERNMVRGKHDLEDLTMTIRNGINARLSTNAVEDVMVESFNFVHRDQVRCAKRIPYRQGRLPAADPADSVP